jgi:acyl carrier protein
VAAALPPRWPTALAQRMRDRFFIKLIGVSAFTTLFFAAYFHLLRNPAYPVTRMPLTALDAMVAFQPHALWIYLSLWVYVGIAPGLMLRWRELIVYGVWVNAMLLAGLACFYFWPTEVPSRAMDVTGYPGFAMLQGVDAAGNACPSMHVAAAVFSACWIERLLRIVAVPRWVRTINLLWVVAIRRSPSSSTWCSTCSPARCWQRPSRGLHCGSRGFRTARGARSSRCQQISSPTAEHESNARDDDGLFTMSSLQELQELIHKKFDIDPAALTPEASLRASGLDSLVLVEILFAIEDHFSISLPDDDQSIDTLAELAALVDKIRAQQPA